MPVPPSADNDRSPEVPQLVGTTTCKGCGARWSGLNFQAHHAPGCPEDEDAELPDLIAPEAMFDPYGGEEG